MAFALSQSASLIGAAAPKVAVKTSRRSARTAVVAAAKPHQEPSHMDKVAAAAAVSIMLTGAPVNAKEVKSLSVDDLYAKVDTTTAKGNKLAGTEAAAAKAQAAGASKKAPKAAAPKPAAPAAPKAAPKAVKKAPAPAPAPVKKVKADTAARPMAGAAAVVPSVVPTKGAKTGMVMEKKAPTSRAAALAAGVGAGAAGASFNLFGKAAAGKAVTTAASKNAATTLVISEASAAEAGAVFAGGLAVSSAGNSIVKKASRVRKIYKVPQGELPLPAQAVVALSVPAGFILTLLSLLAGSL